MIKLYWDDENCKVLVRDLGCEWSWEEYNSSVEEMRAMLSSVEHPVIVLSDARNMKQIPENALQEFYNANKEAPANVLGAVVLVKHRWAELLFTLAVSFIPYARDKVKFARTMEKARKHIAEMQSPPKKRRKRRKEMSL